MALKKGVKIMESILNGLRVWWHNNKKTLYEPVNNVEDAKVWIRGRAQQDLEDVFVIWNAGGLEVFEDGEWCEWYNEDGFDIMELMEQEDE